MKEVPMKKVLKQSFIDTLPVMTGYLVLGFGFGIIIKAYGYGFLHAFLMSAFVYAGSMQYAAIGLFTGGASLVTVAITTFMVNARHIFYGISMIDRYKNTGMKKPYLIFALTDETYSLVCTDNPKIEEKDRHKYYLLVSLFNHFYWILGSVIGAIIGSLVKFNTEGIDFALTALFVTVFIDQWLSKCKEKTEKYSFKRDVKNHFPAIVGVLASALCLIIFGKDNFLIPAMLIIALALCLYPLDKEEAKND
jgi:4-azaleucine resistance transporter AzlC